MTIHVQADHLPPATGLMIWARREGYLDGLLSGLSNSDEGIRISSVRSVLLAYYQEQGKKALNDASTVVNGLPTIKIQHLTNDLVRLADNYNWQ